MSQRADDFFSFDKAIADESAYFAIWTICISPANNQNESLADSSWWWR
jgi:hypothetical protein